MHWFDHEDSEERIEDWSPSSGGEQDSETDLGVESVDFKERLKDAIDVTEASEDAAEEEEEQQEESFFEKHSEKLDKIREEARQEAYEEGYEDGLEEGRASRDEIEQDVREEYDESLEATAEKIDSFVRNLESSLPSVIVKTANLFAKHLLDAYVRQDDEALTSLAEETVRRAGGFDRIELYAHPEAIDVLQERVQSLRRQHPEGATIELHEDPSLEYGDIRIQSSQGSVESILEERLDRLAQTAAEVVGDLDTSDSVETSKESTDVEDTPEAVPDRDDESTKAANAETSREERGSEDPQPEDDETEEVEREAT